MSTLDQIQRLCEEYIGRKFGKRDKNDLLNFLRGLQGQRVGDSDDEQEQQPKYSEIARTTSTKAPPPTVETPAVMKESAPIAKKASAFIGTVAEAYQAPERGAPVKVADFDDIEGVKNRQKKWEEGQVARAESLKSNPDGYKVDETEQTKARKQKWEEGQVIGAEGIKQPVDGYKLEETEEVKARKQKWEGGQVLGAAGTTTFTPEGYKLEETEEVKARKQKWEGGQVIGAEGIKQPVDGYKLEETEEVKARKQKWEGGQVLGAAGTNTFSPEGYKLSDSVGLKDRLNKYSQIASSVPSVKIEKKSVIEESELTSPRTRDRRKQWEEGTVGTPTKEAKTPVKIVEDDAQVDAVKDRLNKWSEVTKDPEPAAARKEPLKIYEEDTQEQS